VSFYNYSMVTGMPPRYIGLGNYEDIVFSFRLWESFGRTLRWVVVTVGIETALGIAIGILFWGSVRLPGRRLALTLLFTPMLLTPLAAGIFFRLMYEPSIGIINYLTRAIGMGTFSFLSDRNLAFASVVFVDVWMWTPFMVLITLAALGSVPKAELEAAEIDRLPWWRRLVTVVLPHAKFILMIGILLRTIESFKTMDLVFNMTGGGPGTTTELVALTLWRRAFEAFNLGWSSALAFILLLMAIAFTSIFLYVLNLRKRQQEREANA
jgi:multiple sugar transport system permease protein